MEYLDWFSSIPLNKNIIKIVKARVKEILKLLKAKDEESQKLGYNLYLVSDFRKYVRNKYVTRKGYTEFLRFPLYHLKNETCFRLKYLNATKMLYLRKLLELYLKGELIFITKEEYYKLKKKRLLTF